MTDYTQANMIAAKLLGRTVRQDYDGTLVLTDDGDRYQPFTIEDDATRMKVVEALGEKHGISILYYCDQDGPHGWYYSEECGAQVYSTYTEAVAAALLAIVEEI